MDKGRRYSIIQNDYEDDANRKFIKYMCKDCKFHNGRCSKKRLARICAQKGLKNRE